MYGVHLDNLDKVTKINEINSEAVKEDLTNIKKNIEELSNCFSGTSISFAFQELQNQQSNLFRIHEVVDNYSIILTEVKNSYVNQDLNVNSTIKSTNSQF